MSVTIFIISPLMGVKMFPAKKHLGEDSNMRVSGPRINEQRVTPSLYSCVILTKPERKREHLTAQNSPPDEIGVAIKLL